MATRLYLNSSAAGEALNSPAFDGSWEATGSAIRRILDLAKDEAGYATSAVATALNSPAGAVDVLIGQWISAPLASGVTISGAIQGQVRASESNAAADLRMQAVIRVLQSDYSTVRGTLIASNGSALSNEFNTSLRNIKIPLGGSTTPTSVAASAGDVIVVELGYRKHENATTSRTGTFDLGAVSGGTDLPIDETTTTQGVPWIEFTESLSFAAAPTRVSQVVAQAAITPPTVETRVSQVVVQVAVSGGVPGSGATPRSWGTIIG